MECPLYLAQRQIGTVCITEDEKDICFTVKGAAPAGWYRICLRGERGELPLGAWEGGTLHRRFSRRLASSAGRIRCAVACPVGEDGGWRRVEGESFCGWRAEDGLWRRCGRLRQLALPFPPDGPFPLPELFCLARICIVAGEQRAVFAFDEADRPVISTDF